MVFKGLIASATAVALATAPTVAAAQVAAPTVPAQTTALAPAGENVEGSELRGGFVIPVIVIIAIILGILAYTNDGDRLPPSP